MATDTVNATPNEKRLGHMLNDIASIAHSALELLEFSEGITAEAQGACAMIKQMGALADCGTRLSNSGIIEMRGDAAAWFNLSAYDRPLDDAAANNGRARS